MKYWEILKPDENKVNDILKKTDLTRLCAEVLVSRGMDNTETLYDFFNNDDISDPFLIKDMQIAVEVITEAIESGELICVYGDYDCDGVTSTALLVNYLEYSGANVMFYIPERSDGYGLNKESIDILNEKGVKLIVTVDNGISAVEEAEYINSLDIKLVITDHHQQGDTLPNALAVVDPHRKTCSSPFKDLSGVGVVFKLCAALEGDFNIISEQYSDIVAIGTVADIVPLKGENRVLVRRGLENLKNTENLGLSYLIQASGLNIENINSSSISFMLAPRINAAGRFGSATIALKALLCEDESAKFAVDELVVLNNQRRETENMILKDILTLINEKPELLNKRVIVLCGRNWHPGVIGILSSRIMELYSKPNFIISFDDNGVGRGSARSCEGFNVFKCLEYAKDTLLKYGGHKFAGGLTVNFDRIDEFIHKIDEYTIKEKVSPRQKLVADKLFTHEDLKIKEIEGLSILEPFGEGNKSPIFAIENAVVKKIIPLSEGVHSKIMFDYDGVTETALLFRKKTVDLAFNVGDKIDMIVNTEINIYNNKKQLSIKVIDYRISGMSQDKYFNAKDAYESYKRGEEVPQNIKHRVVPNRDELIRIYKYIKSVQKIAIDKMYMRFISDSMNYFKLRVIIDIFDELGLVRYIPATQQVKYVEVSKKLDLDDSKVLKNIKSL